MRVIIFSAEFWGFSPGNSVFLTGYKLYKKPQGQIQSLCKKRKTCSLLDKILNTITIFRISSSISIHGDVGNLSIDDNYKNSKKNIGLKQ